MSTAMTMATRTIQGAAAVGGVAVSLSTGTFRHHLARSLYGCQIDGPRRNWRRALSFRAIPWSNGAHPGDDPDERQILGKPLGVIGGLVTRSTTSAPTV
jgi:hypothetical protein